MVRLYLFAEGETERTFADILLKPHLADCGVFLHPPTLIAHARRRGRALRGGGRKYEPMRNDILRFLAQEKAGDVFFTTMIDLYAIATHFPRRDEADGLRHDPFQRVEFLERAFAEDIDDPRFIPHIQLHEYEAILFSGPASFRYFYDRHEAQIAELQAIADRYTSPELIDDGPQSAPSKRIAAQFPDYAKPLMGPEVAVLIGLETIRAKCPHFHAWLSRLENLEP
jgi:Domain of unknown function (DUF4276)